MTTLREVLNALDRTNWSASTKAGEINARDFMADCSEAELAAEVNWLDNGDGTSVVWLFRGSRTNGDGGPYLRIRDHSHCEWSSCTESSILVRTVIDVAPERYGLCAEHAIIDATILGLDTAALRETDEPVSGVPSEVSPK